MQEGRRLTMGYYKQQLIAGQVEVGDRVPTPKPASTHIGWNQRIPSPVTKTRYAYNTSVVLMFSVGFVAGFASAAVLGVF